jgi:hypothetical protein
MKRNIISLILSFLCLLIVFVGSIVDQFNAKLDIVLCIIITVSILVQIVAILFEKRKKD